MAIDNQEPAVGPVFILRGDTWSKTMTIKRNGTAVDVSNYSFKLQIIANGGIVLNVTVNKTNPSGGIVGWTVTSDQTSAILPGIGSWSLIATDNSGNVRTWVKDRFEVK